MNKDVFINAHESILVKQGIDWKASGLQKVLIYEGPLHSTPLTGQAIKPQHQGHIGGPIAQPWGGEVGMSVCMRVV